MTFSAGNCLRSGTAVLGLVVFGLVVFFVAAEAEASNAANAIKPTTDTEASFSHLGVFEAVWVLSLIGFLIDSLVKLGC